MNTDSRIKLTDTAFSAMMKLADGNPGAATAMTGLMSQGEKIDPDGFMGGVGNLLSLDSHGIYGTDIYVLWSDICNKNNAHMIAILRAVQLGYFKESVLQDACSRQDYSGRELVPISDLYKQVRERLPAFDPENIGEPEKV